MPCLFPLHKVGRGEGGKRTGGDGRVQTSIYFHVVIADKGGERRGPYRFQRIQNPFPLLPASNGGTEEI